MRIDNAATITIHGKGAQAESLGALKKGGEIVARIIERIDAHRAVVEIAGKRVTAGFVNGLPPSGHLRLVLEKKSGSTFVFKLAAEDPVGSARERLLDFTAFPRSELGRIPFGRALVGGLTGVYAYNSLLFRLSGGAEKKVGQADLLNALAARGIKIESLLFFSFLFSDFEGINLNCLVSVLSISEREGRKRHNQALKDFVEAPGAFEGLEGVLEALDELVRESPGGEDSIRQLFRSLLGNRGSGDFAVQSGVLNYYDEGFKEARYIGSAEGIAAEADFSRLGRVEVLARDRSGHIHVDIFCGNEFARDEIARDAERLAATAGAAVRRECTVSVRLTDLAMEVIRELGGFLTQGGGFDARV
ncbi:MAG: hypothetical protein KBA15_00285 [Spirochaetes bacterium]|nr:hypothetical protein [Spirochaetota bacterium]